MSAFGRVAVLAGSLAGGLGCSLVVDFSECQSNADCVDEASNNLVCTEAKLCETAACEVDSTCVDKLGSGFRCGPQGVCQSVLTDACNALFVPEDSDPDTLVWVGSVLPTSPPFDEIFVPFQQAIQLAVEDANLSFESSPAIAWVGCDSGGTPTGAVAAARHLVDGVGVQTLIGPGLSESAVAVTREVSVPRGIFTISPSATAKEIDALDDQNLLWRTIPSDAIQANAIGDLLPLLDPVPERVLILAKDDAYGNGLLSSTVDRLERTLPNAQVASLLYRDPLDFSSEEALRNAYGMVIAQGFSHDADTVLVLGTSEAASLILFYLQTRDGIMPTPPLARFVVSHGAVSSLPSVVTRVAESFRGTLMSVLHGVSPEVRNARSFEAFNARYRIRFAENDPFSGAPLAYDAGFVAILGSLAAGGRTATGAEIAAVMPRLFDPEASAVELGNIPGPLRQAESLLSAGESMNLEGVSGSLDFDVTRGELRNDYIHWSVVPRGSDASPVIQPAGRYAVDGSDEGQWDLEP